MIAYLYVCMYVAFECNVHSKIYIKNIHGNWNLKQWDPVIFTQT